jgi:hypothetical protein
MREAVAVGDIVNYYGTNGIAVVASRDGLKTLLTCLSYPIAYSIPDLKLDVVLLEF